MAEAEVTRHADGVDEEISSSADDGESDSGALVRKVLGETVTA